MTGNPVRWTNGVRWGRLWHPVYASRLVFSPAWIPAPLDPSIAELSRVRSIVGLVVVCFLTVVHDGPGALPLDPDGGASKVLVSYPLTVGPMLLVWKARGFPVRLLRAFLWRSAALLVGYVCLIALAAAAALLAEDRWEAPLLVQVCVAGWALVFVLSASWTVARNLFGSAAVHPGLPALITAVTAWLAALLRLPSGQGLVLVLAGPVTVTAIALLELSRLRRRHGVALFMSAGAPRRP